VVTSSNRTLPPKRMETSWTEIIGALCRAVANSSF
jgi:hypothetical protein